MAFKGQCFCVSGTFSVTQAKFLKLLKTHGASVSSNVSSSTTHLVASHTGTAKYQAAKQQKIHIVDEDWIREQIKVSSPTKTKAACKKGISPKKATAGKRKTTAARKPVANIKSEVKKEPTPKQPTAKVKDDIYVHVVDRLCPLPNASVVGEFDAMLNQTNIGGNNNKFYVIQLVQSQLSKSSNPSFHCFTRWGRVGEPGQNAVLGDGTFNSAQEFFLCKFKTKTNNDWSDKDNFVPYPKKYTLIKLKLAAKSKRPLTPAVKKEMPRKKAKVKRDQPDLHPKVKYLLRYIYGEAKQTLTSKVNVTITNEGINTPLGVLDQGQIEICEEILERAVVHVHMMTQQKGSSRKRITELKRTLTEISSEFYTNCPHKTGRTAPPLLDNVAIINEKNELLRLMKDMVNVAARSTADGDENCLHSDDLDEQYRALGCSITYLPPTDPEFVAIQDEIKASQLKSHGREVARIKTIYRIRREEEHQRYQGKKIGRESLLYHGSRIANWVGLLSRGILQPKAVVAQGIHRTDAGWLGSGIYFGNADTASGYAGKGRENTAFMLVNKVALGKTKDYNKITYGIEKPPQGFHSCRGVPGTEFYDEELVVYDNKQFFSSHLVEFET